MVCRSFCHNGSLSVTTRVLLAGLAGDRSRLSRSNNVDQALASADRACLRSRRSRVRIAAGALTTRSIKRDREPDAPSDCWIGAAVPSCRRPSCVRSAGTRSRRSQRTRPLQRVDGDPQSQLQCPKRGRGTASPENLDPNSRPPFSDMCTPGPNTYAMRAPSVTAPTDWVFELGLHFAIDESHLGA